MVSCRIQSGGAPGTVNADGLHFLRALLRNPGAVGAVAPSSRVLAKAMLRGVDLGDGRAVLELGPGTGAFTRLVRERLPDPSRYVAVERDPAFVQLLHVRFPGMRFVEGSAERAADYVREGGLEPLRLILSGLPFASLPARVQDGVMAALEQLMVPGTLFRTFQYLHAWPLPAAVRFRREMVRRFGPLQASRPVMRNVPPAVVLSWSAGS